MFEKPQQKRNSQAKFTSHLELEKIVKFWKRE